MCDAYREAADRIRSHVGTFDPTTATGGAGTASRLITWADNKRINSLCLEHADVISFNDYPGWYQNLGDLGAPAHLWGRYAADVRKHYPLKPFTISETGGGGVYEWRNTTLNSDGVAVQWSQLYQAQLVEADIEVALSDTNISGISLWQFADSKANANAGCGPCDHASHGESLSTPWNCTFVDVQCHRAGGENHKGAVDYWRRKKDVYAVAQRLFTSHTNSSGLHQCGLKMKEQASKAECSPNESFGCLDSVVMWVNMGCRGEFHCNGASLNCESRCDPPHPRCLNPNRTYCACSAADDEPVVSLV